MHGAVVDHRHQGRRDLLADAVAEGRDFLAVEVGLESVAHCFMQQHAGPSRTKYNRLLARRRIDGVQLHDRLPRRLTRELLRRLFIEKKVERDPAAASRVAALRDSIQSGEYEVGVVLPENFAQDVALGQDVTINLYFTANLPEEFKDLYRVFFQELAFTLSGRALNIDAHEELLGVDRSGAQIPYRDRMLPLFAVFILMMETMGLASLIASEVTSGTITALLVTPLRVEGLFVAKGVFGVGFAFIQAAFLMAVTGGLSQQPLLILLLLLLGAVLVTGIAFLIASVSKDMMAVMGWGILAMLVMSLPAFTVLIPGLVTDWVKVIPSYYLVDAVYQVVNGGWGWADTGQSMLALLLFAALFLALGVVVLRRKFQ